MVHLSISSRKLTKIRLKLATGRVIFVAKAIEKEKENKKQKKSITSLGINLRGTPSISRVPFFSFWMGKK